MHRQMKSVLVAGALVAAVALSASGCKSEGKDYDCEEAMDKMYDADCGLYCSYDSDTIYISTCLWYDTGEYSTFSESDANYVCDELDDLAGDEECEGEFQSLLNCLVRERDNCAEDCEDPYDDFMDCVN